MKIKHSLLVLALPFALLAGCDKPVGVGLYDKPPVSVSVYQVQRQTLSPTVTVMGEALSSSLGIRAKATATVKRVLFLPGQQVKKGDVLFEFDEVPLRAALAIADTEMKLARLAYKDAIRESSRIQVLVTKKAATSLESDQALALVAARKDQYQAALASRMDDLFAVRQSKVVAPFDGTVGTSSVVAGDLVTGEAENLVVITKHDQQWVDFSLSLDQFDALQLSKKPPSGVFVTFTDDTMAGVSLIEPVQPIDRSLSTLTVRAQLLAPSTSFIPGDEVLVEVKVPMVEPMTLVPKAAIRENSEGHYVFVVVDGKVDVRQVSALRWDGQDWLVSDGLKPDDQVITTNFTKIRVGARVIMAPVLGAAVSGDTAPTS